MKIFFTIVLFAIAATGCATKNVNVEPVYTVQNHPVAVASRGLDAAEVSQAIAEAAKSGGWTVDRISATEIKATLKWDDHAAIVSVANDSQGFSIRNNGSVNLRDHDGVIHKRYNTHVRALESSIEKQLAKKPYAPTPATTSPRPAAAPSGATATPLPATVDGKYNGHGKTDSWCQTPFLEVTLKGNAFEGHLSQVASRVPTSTVTGTLFPTGTVTLEFKRGNHETFFDGKADGTLANDVLSISWTTKTVRACNYKFELRKTN